MAYHPYEQQRKKNIALHPFHVTYNGSMTEYSKL
jgi:hypothetical protein